MVAATPPFMAKPNVFLTLTWKRTKSNDNSAVKEHLLFYNNSPDYKDFSITTNKNDFKVNLQRVF